MAVSSTRGLLFQDGVLLTSVIVILLSEIGPRPATLADNITLHQWRWSLRKPQPHSSYHVVPHDP
jgi:hypothetical protein